MIKRLTYTTAILSVVLIALWAFRPSTTFEEGASPRIKLEPPLALAQSSNFPSDYAGIIRYVKFDPISFDKIQSAASSTATEIKKTDGTSYVWITITDTSWPVYDLYADVNGWVVLFLPKKGGDNNTMYMFARGWHYEDWSTTSIGDYSVSGHGHRSLGYRSTRALLKFTDAAISSSSRIRNRVTDNSSFYHFSYPSSTSIYFANKINTNQEKDQFVIFIPGALTVEEVSSEYWSFGTPNFMSIDGAEINKDVDENTTWLSRPTLGTGQHTVELSKAGVNIAIMVR